MDDLRKLPGTRDVDESYWLQLKGCQDLLMGLFSRWGYQIIDTPLFEPTELFVRKGGGELAGQMYSFVDPGGNEISLRPEFTSSVMRYCIENTESLVLPWRAQYSGPVFRYSGSGQGYRQFNQSGVELVGSANPLADVEVLALACQGLASLGLKGPRLVLGDIQIFNELLGQFDLSERAKVFVLTHLNILRDGLKGMKIVRERAERSRLISSGKRIEESLVDIENLGESEALDHIANLLDRDEHALLGQRNRDEVAEGLIRKLKRGDTQAKFDEALEVVAALASVKGQTGEALVVAREVLKKAGVGLTSFDRLKGVIDLTNGEDLGGASLAIDFGLVRGIGYYTGIVFELMGPHGDISLGGGGRYDGLAESLGSDKDLPSFGFTYNIDQILDNLQEIPTSITKQEVCDSILVVPTNPDAYSKALVLVGELRTTGRKVEMEVCGRSVKDNLSYARTKKISAVVEISEDGERTTHKIG